MPPIPRQQLPRLFPDSNQASLTPHLTPVVHPLPSLTLPFPAPSDTADTLFGFTDFISLGNPLTAQNYEVALIDCGSVDGLTES